MDLDRRPAAGLVGRLVGFRAHHSSHALAQHHPQVFVVIDLPTSLLLLFLQITVFIGLASRDMSDDDREWWARAGAWILIIGLSWLVAAAVAILGPLALDAGLAALGLSEGSGRVGLSLFTLALGQRRLAADRGAGITGQEVALRERDRLVLAAPLTTILLVVLVSDANRLLLDVRPRPASLSRDAASR